MKVLLDTNVVLDVLEKREKFFQHSYSVMQLAAAGSIQGFMSAGSVTDVYYIIKRSVRDAGKAKDAIVRLGALLDICDTTTSDINAALTMNIDDFEDAVIAAVAKREKADCIVTRNKEDFVNSPIPAMLPSEWMEQYAS
jgi:predicted nucleic acid-binding protein